MVIHDLDFEGIAVRPAKADAPAVVDPNAVLSAAVAVRSFEPVPWWRTQEVERSGGVQHRQLPLRLSPDREPPAGTPTREKGRCIPVGERLDHDSILHYAAFNGKR